MIRLFGILCVVLSMTMQDLVSGFQMPNPVWFTEKMGRRRSVGTPNNNIVDIKLSMFRNDDHKEDVNENDRRSVMVSLLKNSILMSIGMNVFPSSAAAATVKPQEFTNMGTQAPPPEGESNFVVLENGVKYKDFRAGNGDEVVTSGSKVFIQCTGRLLNLNGVVFYSTKANNNIDGFGPEPLVFTIGRGEALPGLESAMKGMKKNSIRRIIVPPNLGYDMTTPNLEPKPVNDNDQRALDSVLKNPRRDATILFDVQVERIK